MALCQMQKTLRRAVSVSGLGLFTGEHATLYLQPAKPDEGIVFERLDLPSKPRILAHVNSVGQAQRCTRLERDSASVTMVEHLLSALSVYEIDNVHVCLEGPEVPVGDGSAAQWVEAIEEAGTVFQESSRQFYQLKAPVVFSEKEVHLIALPSDELQIQYALHYPESKRIGSQYFSFKVDKETYKSQIASCRTFCLYEEIMPFIEKGVIRGGGLHNALIIQGEQVLNPEGVRFPDEMVRHKVLDLIGDLALLGKPLLANIIAIRSGHRANILFAKKILNHVKEQE